MKKLFTAILLMMFTCNNAQTFKYGKVSIDELKATTCALDSTATAAILYNERYTHFEYDEEIGFYIVDEYFMRMKIYSIEGYDYATHSIAMYNSNSTKEEIIGLKGTTYTLENGEIVKTKLDNDAVFFEKTNKYWSQKKFTMPNLKVGAVLEWVYTLKSPFISKLDEVNLQSEIPILKTTFLFIFPEYLVYNTNTKGYLNIPIVNENKGRTLDLSYMDGLIMVQLFKVEEFKIPYPLMKKFTK
jgi:hypothetical protein